MGERSLRFRRGEADLDRALGFGFSGFFFFSSFSLIFFCSALLLRLRLPLVALRLARALAPELVLELPELLEDELERDVDPDVELWDELDPLDDRELLSDELQINNTIKTNYSH